MALIRKLWTIITLFFLSAFAIVSTFSLTSCSILVPFFHAPKELTAQCAQDAQINVTANWRDYYFDDVVMPTKENGGINFHNNDELVQVTSSSKEKDPVKKIQTINIKFECKEDLPLLHQNFNIDILWSIKHTSFKQTTTLHFTHPSIYIPIDFFFATSSQPNDISHALFPRNPNDWLTSHGDTISIIDDIYKTEDSNKNGQIYNNLFNDFFYWQYLTLANLKHIVIDNSWLNIYVDTDSATWNMGVQGNYNRHTGVFDFLSIHIDAFATYHFLVADKKANIHIDFCWGKNPNMHDQWFDIGDVQEDIDGPELLGAYSLNNAFHVPQDKTMSPYNQNFLSLVPSTPNALQLFNLRVNQADDSHKDQNILVTSCYHSYFLQQPRMMGLEYQSGQDHLFDLDSMPTGSYDKYTGFFDSFKNWGLVIPSYYLSGVDYDEDTHTIKQAYQRPNIPPCELNLDSVRPTLQNNIKDINDGDKQTDQVGFCNNWLQSYENISAQKLDYPTNDGIFTEWAPSYDKKTGNPIKCQDFITSKLNEQVMNFNCVSSWTPITATTSGGSVRRSDLPWFQVIQQRSPSLRGKQMATYWDDNHNNWDWPTCKDGKQHKIPKQNIIWDSENTKFQSFCLGLNYMFTCTNHMVPGQDNLFNYSNPQDIALTQPAS